MENIAKRVGGAKLRSSPKAGQQRKFAIRAFDFNFILALLEAGIQQEQHLFVEGALEQFQLGFSVAEQFLQSSRPPTAVMPLTDVIAVGTLHAAWKAGLSLPRDLSVTGFDDVPLARYSMPELTTATQPVFEMGKQAALRLLRRIQKPDLKVRRTLLPISIVIRESTAPARLL